MEAPTLARIRSGLRRENPDTKPTVAWVKRPRFVTYPTGATGYVAQVIVSAEGYRTRKMFVSSDHDSLRIA